MNTASCQNYVIVAPSSQSVFSTDNFVLTATNTSSSSINFQYTYTFEDRHTSVVDEEMRRSVDLLDEGMFE